MLTSLCGWLVVVPFLDEEGRGDVVERQDGAVQDQTHHRRDPIHRAEPHRLHERHAVRMGTRRCCAGDCRLGGAMSAHAGGDLCVVSVSVPLDSGVYDDEPHGAEHAQDEQHLAEEEGRRHTQPCGDDRRDEVIEHTPAPRHTQIHPQRHGHLSLLEVLHEQDGGGHVEALAAQPEAHSASEHQGHVHNVTPQTHHRLSDDQECVEDDESGPDAHDVDEVSEEQRQEDVGQRIDRVEEIEVELELRH
mmetsp:Transcript_30065/g.74671  ORF Transcript_30065/g.74671 Transcript_30065/m.74671 type:complete len:247 (-) Transcript_30065:210-950(-)